MSVECQLLVKERKASPCGAAEEKTAKQVIEARFRLTVKRGIKLGKSAPKVIRWLTCE